MNSKIFSLKNLVIYLIFSSTVNAAGDSSSISASSASQPQETFRYPTPFKYPQTRFKTEVEKKKEAVIEEKIELTEKGAPRMKVRGFRIVGIDEDFEHGISQKIIDELVKQKAEDMLKAEASKGFTVSMFETITSTISRYYRYQGYILARAYIPEQTINDGIVQINIVEGFLDQVVYNNNRLYSDQQLTKAFDPKIGQSVFKENVEQVLFDLNNYPGLRANMIFGPGLKPGSSAIQLNVIETPSTTALSVDNYGSTFTGEYRYRIQHSRNNMFGQADKLDLNLILTASPANSLYYDVFYDQKYALFGLPLRVGGGLKINSFDIGGNLSDLGINGDSSVIFGQAKYIYSQTRDEQITFTGGLHLKSSESKVQSTLDSKDNLTVITLAGDYAGRSWSSSDVFQTLNVTLSIGLPEFLGSMDSNGNEQSGRQGGSDAFAGGDFTKVAFNYTRTHFLSPLESLNFTFKGQLSSDLLSTTEQYSLGGVNSVRAYPVAESLMDKVYVGSVEWFIKTAPETSIFGLQDLKFSLFYDLAKGSLNDPLTNDVASVSYSGFGGSVEINPYKNAALKMSIGFITGDDETGEQSLPFYLNFTHAF